MRMTARQRAETMSRWGPWLKTRLEHHGLTMSKLADSLLSLRPDGEPVRSLVSRWVDQHVAVSPKTAWNVGVILSKFGPEDNGPVALYAAGHYERLVAFLVQLGRRSDGARAAVSLHLLLPEAVDILLTDPPSFANRGALARQYLGVASSDRLELFNEVWGVNAGTRLPVGVDDYGKLAYSVLLADVDRLKALRWSWDMLGGWAIRIDGEIFRMIHEEGLRFGLELHSPDLLRSQLRKARMGQGEQDARSRS